MINKKALTAAVDFLRKYLGDNKNRIIAFVVSLIILLVNIATVPTVWGEFK